MSSTQLRYAAECIKPYGEDGCADITTRANLQLRGVKLEDADRIIEGLIAHRMSSFQSGMDSVRNLTGSPIAGLDPHELFDTRYVHLLLILYIGSNRVRVLPMVWNRNAATLPAKRHDSWFSV